MSREKTETVGITLRVREELRRDLEQAAQARRVSLNQEVIDRCEYVRMGVDLLPEFLKLAYGERAAGLLMMLGPLIGPAGAQKDAGDWTTDADAYEDVAATIIAVLRVLHPKAKPPTAEEARDVPALLAWSAVRGLLDHEHPDYRGFKSHLAAIRALLAPTVARWSAPPLEDIPDAPAASQEPVSGKVRGSIVRDRPVRTSGSSAELTIEYIGRQRGQVMKGVRKIRKR